MLRVLRQGRRWLVTAVVLGVGGVFVFFMGWGAPSQTAVYGNVVEVGPYHYDLRAFERERAAREQQYQETLGEQFDADAMSEAIDHLATETLIQRSILAMAAEEMGLRVAKKEIEAEVLSIDAFREDGRFDTEAFKSWAEWEYGNQRNFMASQRRSMLATKMARLIRELAFVSEGEARDALSRRMQEVKIAFVKLDASAPPADLALGDERVEGFLAAREAEARAFYDENSARFNTPEQVRARHVLVRVPADASEEQKALLRQKAEGVLERLRGGEGFPEVALEVSEDPGSKENGGDLGFFGRGQMVKPFEDAAFALEPGTLGDVVESDFGFHVIRSEEYRAAQSRGFDEVKQELAREILGREAAREQARNLAEALAKQIREGESLEAAGRSRKLTLERTDWLPRRPDGYVPGLGAAQDLLATAFTLEPGQSAEKIFEVGDQLALVQLLERQDPDPEKIEAQLDSERTAMLERKRERQIETWIRTRRAALLDAGDIRVNLEITGS